MLGADSPVRLGVVLRRLEVGGCSGPRGAALHADWGPVATGRMSGAAMILVIVIVIVVAAVTVVYFSPFQSCVRSTDARTVDDSAFSCAVALGGRR